MSAAPSVNFAFLAVHDEQLVHAAGEAERLFADHPKASLMMLRVFAELLAQRVAASAGVFTRLDEPQAALLGRLKGQGILTREVADLFSEGQDPTKLGHVYLESKKTKRPALYVAKIVGNSMTRIAADGAWCLWQHTDAIGVLAAASGEYVIARREDPDDLHFGGFTFKRWERTEAGARLSPVSKDKKFKPILLTPGDEQTTKHIARFVEVLHIEHSEVTA